MPNGGFMNDSDFYAVCGVTGDHEEECTFPLVVVHGAEHAKAVIEEFSSDKVSTYKKYGIDINEFDAEFFTLWPVPGGILSSRTDEP